MCRTPSGLVHIGRTVLLRAAFRRSSGTTDHVPRHNGICGRGPAGADADAAARRGRARPGARLCCCNAAGTGNAAAAVAAAGGSAAAAADAFAAAAGGTAAAGAAVGAAAAADTAAGAAHAAAAVCAARRGSAAARAALDARSRAGPRAQPCRAGINARRPRRTGAKMSNFRHNSTAPTCQELNCTIFSAQLNVPNGALWRAAGWRRSVSAFTRMRGQSIDLSACESMKQLHDAQTLRPFIVHMP